ncbi:MAG: ATP-binding protein [Nitrospirota bacterium]
MKKLRFQVALAVAAFLVVVAFVIQLYYMQFGIVPFMTRLTLLLLLNLTVIALLVLMFFVAKSFIKLYIERRHRVLGYKFKTKLVVILVILTLIPATILFLVAGGLITNYMDRWFVPQIKQPLESSIEIAKSVYEIERNRLLLYGKGLRAGKAVKGEYTVTHLSRMPRHPTETVKAAFEGKEGTEVVSGRQGDIIRAVIPEYTHDKQTGVMVIEYLIPAAITENVEEVKDAYEYFLALEAWKLPIKVNYLLILGFFTLLVVFMALWVALRISRGITEPIQQLAQATELVAAGNLDTEIDIKREDEIGLLINSFNHMVRELKEGKETLQSAYLESDRRRLFMENILDNINSGVILLDTNGEVLMISKRACEIINITPEQAINRHYRHLMSQINSKELQNLVSGIEGREFKPVQKEIKAVIGDKKAILLVFITSLKDAQNYIGLLVVFEDLTEVIEAQKALTWQDVARKIAHEIKNPLTPIKLSTERMIKKWERKDTDFDEVFHRSAKTIVKEVDSLKRLVDEFSRFGKMPAMHKTPISLAAIVNEVVNLYRDYKGILMTVSIPDDMPPVELDGEQFRRVLINVFDNAIQALTNSGRIDVSVGFEESLNRSYIEIADNGPGIRDEDKEKLFLPYFSTKKTGTGLGLAIANRIIKEHGGFIRVRDNEPEGTVFTIEIPIKENV